MGSDENKWLKGIAVQLVTPLMEDEALDSVAMKKNHPDAGRFWRGCFVCTGIGGGKTDANRRNQE